MAFAHSHFNLQIVRSCAVLRFNEIACCVQRVVMVAERPGIAVLAKPTGISTERLAVLAGAWLQHRFELRDLQAAGGGLPTVSRLDIIHQAWKNFKFPLGQAFLESRILSS